MDGQDPAFLMTGVDGFSDDSSFTMRQESAIDDWLMAEEGVGRDTRDVFQQQAGTLLPGTPSDGFVTPPLLPPLPGMVVSPSEVSITNTSDLVQKVKMYRSVFDEVGEGYGSNSPYNEEPFDANRPPAQQPTIPSNFNNPPPTSQQLTSLEGDEEEIVCPRGTVAPKRRGNPREAYGAANVLQGPTRDGPQTGYRLPTRPPANHGVPRRVQQLMGHQRPGDRASVTLTLQWVELESGIGAGGDSAFVDKWRGQKLALRLNVAHKPGEWKKRHQTPSFKWNGSDPCNLESKTGDNEIVMKGEDLSGIDCLRFELLDPGLLSDSTLASIEVPCPVLHTGRPMRRRIPLVTKKGFIAGYVCITASLAGYPGQPVVGPSELAEEEETIIALARLLHTRSPANTLMVYHMLYDAINEGDNAAGLLARVRARMIPGMKVLYVCVLQVAPVSPNERTWPQDTLVRVRSFANGAVLPPPQGAGGFGAPESLLPAPVAFRGHGGEKKAAPKVPVTWIRHEYPADSVNTMALEAIDAKTKECVGMWQLRRTSLEGGLLPRNTAMLAHLTPLTGGAPVAIAHVALVVPPAQDGVAPSAMKHALRIRTAAVQELDSKQPADYSTFENNFYVNQESQWSATLSKQ